MNESGMILDMYGEIRSKVSSQGTSEPISTKPLDLLDAPANQSAFAARERENRHLVDQPHAFWHRDLSRHNGWTIPPSTSRP